MKPVNNIHFAKDGQTRYVKHGFSWQIALFGPIAYFWRGQYLLAALCIPALYVLYMLTLVVTILLLDLPDPMPELVGVLVTCGLAGVFGNRFSARSYVKNGWLPVGDFPKDWNTPVLVPAASSTQVENP